MLIRTVKDFKKPHLGSPMRLTTFIILLKLISNLKCFAFSYPESAVTKPYNSSASSCYRNGARNHDWFVLNSFLSDTVAFKSNIQIVCENWVTVLCGNYKCCYFNWRLWIGFLILSYSGLMGPLRLFFLIWVSNIILKFLSSFFFSFFYF